MGTPRGGQPDEFRAPDPRDPPYGFARQIRTAWRECMWLNVVAATARRRTGGGSDERPAPKDVRNEQGCGYADDARALLHLIAF